MSNVDSTRPNASPYSSVVSRANVLADKLAAMLGSTCAISITRKRKGVVTVTVTEMRSDGHKRTISGTIYE